MAGIYIHVPFCQCRCRYCDFFSTTLSPLMESYIDAACRELVLRRPYLGDQPVTTLYLGGGTPSQLSPTLIGRLIHTATELFTVSTFDELTIEANPDDITPEWVGALRNELPDLRLRISMGIQTFDDATLRLLGRRHTAQEAIEAVQILRDHAISDISIDLMYGLPHQTPESWKNDLDQALSLGVPHLSAYHLSYEEGTPLWRMLQRGEVKEADEEQSVEYFRMLRHALLNTGYVHYEISNFALPGHQAIHNSNYWAGVPYLGIGPGAHSYNGTSRQWNNPDLPTYIDVLLHHPEALSALSSGEELTADERYDEYIMTRLRTAHGISLEEIGVLFGSERQRYAHTRTRTYINNGRLRETADHRLVLTEEGIFISDGIIADLFA